MPQELAWPTWILQLRKVGHFWHPTYPLPSVRTQLLQYSRMTSLCIACLTTTTSNACNQNICCSEICYHFYQVSSLLQLTKSELKCRIMTHSLTVMTWWFVGRALQLRRTHNSCGMHHASYPRPSLAEWIEWNRTEIWIIVSSTFFFVREEAKRKTIFFIFFLSLCLLTLTSCRQEAKVAKGIRLACIPVDVYV